MGACDLTTVVLKGIEGVKLGAATFGTKSFEPIAIANGLLGTGSLTCLAIPGLSSEGNSVESNDVHVVFKAEFRSEFWHFTANLIFWSASLDELISFGLKIGALSGLKMLAENSNSLASGLAGTALGACVLLDSNLGAGKFSLVLNATFCGAKNCIVCVWKRLKLRDQINY